MHPIPTDCPSCHTALTVTRLRCPSCQAALEGTFDLPPVLRLAPDELAFVSAFVKASGSLKEMARLREQSYPTIRNKLDEIISNLASLEAPRANDAQAILDAIAKGTMSVAEAAKRLREEKP